MLRRVNTSPDMLYLGRSRLHRSRANLLQTLRTVAALEGIGVRVRVHLPPWPRGTRPAEVLQTLGIDRELDLRASHLLHPRLHYWPFIRLHARRLRGARVVYTRVPEISAALAGAGVRHHLEVHEFQKLEGSPLLDRLLRAHGEGALATLLPISGGAAAKLIAAGADPRRVVVAPSGVDVERFASAAAFDPARLDRPRVVCLGRMSRDRGLAVFQAAAAAGCEVTLVGDQEAFVREDPRLRVEPFVPPREAPRWYGRCDVALIPYQPELPQVDSMSPIKLFEAMAAGRPIIASDLPTIREVIEHERNGLLVPASDLGAWTGAIDRLRHDRALAVRLAAAARGDAARYAWSARARTIARAVGLAAG